MLVGVTSRLFGLGHIGHGLRLRHFFRRRLIGVLLELPGPAFDLVKFEGFFAKIDMEIIVDHMGRVPCDLGTTQPAFQILKRFMQRRRVPCVV